MAAADTLVTSRLSLVEAARAFIRLRAKGLASEVQLADAGRELDALWARCEIWELTPLVCETASQVAPARRCGPWMPFTWPPTSWPGGA
jgi:hypothetical protein